MSSNSSNELVSVVIVNYNRRDDLREAIQSIDRQDYPSFEVIVVDNASRDDSVEMLSREFPKVKVIKSAENLGMDGYSVGFREARGTYVFQMDNDSEMPDPTVLSEVVRRFREGSPKLAVVATRVEEAGFPRIDVQVLRARDQRRGPLNLRHFHSGGVGFRKSALDQVGYYNRDVFLYGSEMFLEIKFLAAGFEVLMYPEILMLHKGSPTARSPLFLYYTVRNGLWYMRCHGTALQKLRYIPISLLYNLGQGLWKRQLSPFLRAARDGLGALPPSLQNPIKSNNPDYVARVHRVGQWTNAASLIRNVVSRLRGTL